MRTSRRHFYALLVWWFLAASADGPTAVGPFKTSDECEVHRASRALAGAVTAPCWNQRTSTTRAASGPA